MIKSATRLGLAACAAASVGWMIVSCARPGLRTAARLVDQPSAHRHGSLDDIVSATVAVVAVVAYAVFLTTALVAIGAHIVAPRHAARVAASRWAGPAWWRAAVLTACGIGVAVQATTAEAAFPDRPPCAAACAPSLDGLPYPDLPTGLWARHSDGSRPEPLAAATRDHRPASPRPTVVVQPGDSLWSIAADLSSSHAGDAAVAAAVARLYAANRSVIGDDPDLIYPGNVLNAPGGPS